MKNMITKTYEITATEDVIKRFERFLAFMHFNGGHSATFGMPFDGDGADILKVNPPPPLVKSEGKESDHNMVAGCGPTLEVAYNNSYAAYRINKEMPYYTVENGVKKKFYPDGTVAILN